MGLLGVNRCLQLGDAGLEDALLLVEFAFEDVRARVMIVLDSFESLLASIREKSVEFC